MPHVNTHIMSFKMGESLAYVEQRMQQIMDCGRDLFIGQKYDFIRRRHWQYAEYCTPTAYKIERIAGTYTCTVYVTWHESASASSGYTTPTEPAQWATPSDYMPHFDRKTGVRDVMCRVRRKID